jgi:hypothetical protein
MVVSLSSPGACRNAGRMGNNVSPVEACRMMREERENLDAARETGQPSRSWRGPAALPFHLLRKATPRMTSFRWGPCPRARHRALTPPSKLRHLPPQSEDRPSLGGSRLQDRQDDAADAGSASFRRGTISLHISSLPRIPVRMPRSPSSFMSPDSPGFQCECHAR